jgi:hypothetical protein
MASFGTRQRQLGLMFSRFVLSTLLVVIAASCASPSQRLSRQGRLNAGADPTASMAPAPNVRGADIRVIEEGGFFDAAPTVSPATPLELVIDDCTDFVLFDTAEVLTDKAAGVMVLYWTEPSSDKARSLTIHVRSPSCAAHAEVQSLMGQGRS